MCYNNYITFLMWLKNIITSFVACHGVIKFYFLILTLLLRFTFCFRRQASFYNTGYCFHFWRWHLKWCTISKCCPNGAHRYNWAHCLGRAILYYYCLCTTLAVREKYWLLIQALLKERKMFEVISVFVKTAFQRACQQNLMFSLRPCIVKYI